MMLRQLVKVTDAYPLTETDIALITTASSLHDIGKIRIPEEILNKPGRLPDEEFKIMKTHSELGAAIIKDMDFPQDHPLVHTAWEICRWHHERWDGKGYPDGLKGEEIPISAQVVSIVMFRQEIHGLCCLFQIVDFRPLFIALTLRRLDTVLNVDKQRNAALLSGGFRRLCPSARYPFPYGFLCIIRAEGFKTGEAFLSGGAA